MSVPILQPAPSRLPPGQRIYAIGDIHGCADRLGTLHDAIAADLAANPAAHSTLLHIGDYTDRGPDTRAVLDRLVTGEGLPPVTARVDLFGNHEEMMLAALAGDHPDHWLLNGGDATLASYEIDPYTHARTWRDRIPDAHRTWLETLPRTHEAGGYLFVHAGLRPGVPLDEQEEHDLLWIREPFLSSDEQRPFVTVHGHTPVRQPTIRPNRIGIDTGAVLGGPLTCLVLEEDGLRFLAA